MDFNFWKVLLIILKDLSIILNDLSIILNVLSILIRTKKFKEFSILLFQRIINFN
jgi:hypothetical protein